MLNNYKSVSHLSLVNKKFCQFEKKSYLCPRKKAMVYGVMVTRQILAL